LALVRDLNQSKGRCPVDICLPPARRRQHICHHPPKGMVMKIKSLHLYNRSQASYNGILMPTPQRGVGVFIVVGDLNRFKCRCPVDICLPPARRRQHIYHHSPKGMVMKIKSLHLYNRGQASYNDILMPTPQRGVGAFIVVGDLNRFKCRCPVDICLPPARRRQYIYCHSIREWQ